ncbi:hypothetical protein ACWC24_39960, partial [Streptomyces sp. NPDC001443]
QIVARLVPRITAQAPQRSAAEHERVARWVLERILAALVSRVPARKAFRLRRQVYEFTLRANS